MEHANNSYLTVNWGALNAPQLLSDNCFVAPCPSMMIHFPLVADNLPMKTLVAKQLPVTIHTSRACGCYQALFLSFSGT